MSAVSAWAQAEEPAVGNPSAAEEGALIVPAVVPQAAPGSRREAIPSGASGAARAPGPGLDALLQLPSGYRTRSSPAVAGADETEWRRRFVKAERALATARVELERTKRELDEVAEGGGASQWAVAPPGASTGAGGPSTSPLSFKHREAMRRNREEVDAAERALRELKIEADLAGVPAAWRAAAAPGSSRAVPN